MIKLNKSKEIRPMGTKENRDDGLEASIALKILPFVKKSNSHPTR